MTRVSQAIAFCCRIVLAAVFIFSGLAKSVDPWGTALKIGDYISAMGLGVSENVTLALSVLLCGGELLLGLGLLFGVRRRETSFLVMIAMCFFTITTLWIAIANPIADCGCFGDAVKLTNWQTFFKNIVLLPMSIILFAVWRRGDARWKMRHAVEVCVLGAVAYGLCFYSLCKLSPVDFLPYKVGVDLLADTSEQEDSGDVKTTLIYKDKSTGAEREFSLEDTEWQDTTRWEFVDTIIEMDNRDEDAARKAVSEFAIFRGADMMTEELLTKHHVVLITRWNADKPLNDGCRRMLERAIERAKSIGAVVVGVTPTSLDRVSDSELAGSEIEYYNMDAKTLKMLMRSRVGVVNIMNGIIVSKNSCCSCAL